MSSSKSISSSLSDKLCVGDRCVENEELIQGAVIFSIAFIVSVLSVKNYTKNLSKKKVYNDHFIHSAVRIWGFVFVVLVILLSLYAHLEITSVLYYVSISCVAMQCSGPSKKLASRIFLVHCTCSWYGLFKLLMTSNNGEALAQMLSLPGLLAFYSYTSVVVAGHMVEKDELRELYAAVFPVTVSICLWLSMVPVELCALQLLPETYHVLISSFFKSSTETPQRFKELDLDHYSKTLHVVIMLAFHTATHFVIHSVEENEEEERVQSSTGTAGQAEETGAAQRQQQRPAPLSSLEQEELLEEANTNKELPSDTIEISLDEAIELQSGNLRFRNNKLEKVSTVPPFT